MEELVSFPKFKSNLNAFFTLTEYVSSLQQKLEI